MPISSTATLPVFRPGVHTALDGRTVTFTHENCLDLAESYDPTLMEAPFVIGHPKLDAPAYGWANKFEVRNGLVYAEPKQVITEFAEAFNSGMYKKRSLSIYLPDSPGNPKPGHYYPRHVGFLGAVPPGVKGLPDVSFAECDVNNAPLEFALPWEDGLLIDLLRSLRDYIIEKDNVEKADQVLPTWRIESYATALEARSPETDLRSTVSYAEHHKEETPPMKTSDSQTELDARKAQLDVRENALKAREQEAQKAALERKRTDITEFAEGLVKDGKLLPVHKNKMIEVLVSLPSAVLSFADGGSEVTETPETLLRDILQFRPAVLDFSEKSSTEKGASVEFADPHALAAAAQDYMAEQEAKGRTISATQAVNHVKGVKS